MRGFSTHLRLQSKRHTIRCSTLVLFPSDLGFDGSEKFANIFGGILLSEGRGGRREFANVVAEKSSGLFGSEWFGVDRLPNGIHSKKWGVCRVQGEEVGGGRWEMRYDRGR